MPNFPSFRIFGEEGQIQHFISGVDLRRDIQC